MQFLQAEKTIRLRSLVEIGYNLSEIDAILSEVKEREASKDENGATDLMHGITDITFEEDIDFRLRASYHLLCSWIYRKKYSEASQM